MKLHLKTILAIVLALFFTVSACTAKEKTRQEAAQIPDNIEVLKKNGVSIHTFFGVSNSHIIETGKGLYLVDAQMTLSDARKVSDYMDTLGKPLKKVIITHNHPDHWFGAQVFKGKAPIVASANVTSDLKTGGGRFLKIMKKKLKDNMPDRVIIPDAEFGPGSYDFDGIAVIVEEYKEQEAHHSIVLKLPEQGVFIAQDLIYNKMFLVASEPSRNQHWIELLQQFQKTLANDYPYVMTGHGKNGGVDLFQQNIDYLTTLDNVLKMGLNKEETTQKMIEHFPNYGGKGMLNISMRNLFSKGH